MTFNPQKWRSSPVYQQELARFLETPTGKALIGVLYSTVPTPVGQDATQALISAGRQSQHLLNIRMIEKLAEMPDPDEGKAEETTWENDPLDEILKRIE